ncbi:TUBGCP5 [Cervus elaphus hippelaphus]|uniref:TUBGCP5 n=1 Tax=Cervus elaphus hippelaphus TaxID=46360 RepID=A0A212C237_CEREH|nr:TUBGCP5 [Cervus elaphus hippelaphus]
MASLPQSWSRLDRRQERDVRELVRLVAGVQDEADPNFQLALHFAWSNFRFHRFLDVNSHKVEKTIEGIYEKFIIHSDLSKAASWKRLTEEFLNASLPSIKELKVCYIVKSLLYFTVSNLIIVSQYLITFRHSFCFTVVHQVESPSHGN